MKYPSIPRFHEVLIATAMLLSGTAMAHPGGHAEHSTTLSGVKHFFSHIDHVGPVIAVLLLAVFAFRRRGAISASISGWKARNRKHHEP